MKTGVDEGRRATLRGIAAAAACAAISPVFTRERVAHAAGADDALPAEAGLRWAKAPCRFCGTGCHVEVGVQGGKVVAIQGDAKAEVNKGLLCVKGYNVAEILYGKDRLTTPMLRRNGKLEPITWDQAIAEIASRINKAPDRFAFYGSGQWTVPEGYAANKFMKGGLSNNHIDPNARLCMASAVTGFLGTYGVDEPANCYDDLDQCTHLICWGNNPAEMHPMLMFRLTERLDEITIIDIGTRSTRTTEFADHFMQMDPHGDMAIANGVAHLLLKRGTYSKEFVENHCNFRKQADGKQELMGVASSFEEYQKLMQPYTPEHAAKLAGIPVKQIELLADIFGDPKNKIVSMWCMGMNQHTRGTAINELVHGLHLLSGHFGRPGDGPMSLTGQPSACGTVREVGTLSHALPGGRLVANAKHREQCEGFWNLPSGRINSKPGFHTVAMWDEFTKPDGAINMIWVQVTNPGQTLPNLNEYFNDKPADKFLVVSDVYPTLTTALADLILPSAMWVEKNGVFGNSERRTQQWFKQVDPPGQARDDCWQIIAVARKLYELGHAGMKDKDGTFLFNIVDGAGKPVPAWQWEHYYDVNVDEQLFEEYRPFTHMKHKNVAPYQELVKARGLRWPVVEASPGVWKETLWRFSEGLDPFVEKGKGVDFYHSTTNDGKAQIWFHPYEAPPEVPDSDYPLWLCTGRVVEHWHSGSMTMRCRALKGAMPDAYVEMNPQDAADMGLPNGSKVVVESRRGSIEAELRLNFRSIPKRGNVFVPFYDENIAINKVTLHDYCPISKQPDYKKCAVRIRKAE